MFYICRNNKLKQKIMDSAIQHLQTEVSTMDKLMGLLQNYFPELENLHASPFGCDYASLFSEYVSGNQFSVLSTEDKRNAFELYLNTQDFINGLRELAAELQ